ncbi:unnamed protein product [Calypogeia fissa]
MSTDCSQTIDLTCRDKTYALHLKIGAIFAIFTASTLGVLIPLVGKKAKYLRTDTNFFFVAKAFAAGVILATGFCHMMPDAESALTNPCLPANPWSKFPWQGFIPMMAALCTLLVDALGTEYYEKKHGFSAHAHGHGMITHHDPGVEHTARIGKEVSPFDHQSTADEKGQALGVMDTGGDVESKSGRMHIIGMKAHAASHSHSHAEGHHGSSQLATQEQQETTLRHVVISQVLELGIVAHSVIIGLTLGVSDSPCHIRPLMVALVFHQFFEGFALGGCISQAGFKRTAAAIMVAFFALTTPLGICLGLGIQRGYNENSQEALIVEGVFDAISAGILIYMALVDLIAADFLSKRLRCDRQLQVFAYLALFAGAGAMSAIAIWA